MAAPADVRGGILIFCTAGNRCLIGQGMAGREQGRGLRPKCNVAAARFRTLWERETRSMSTPHAVANRRRNTSVLSTLRDRVRQTLLARGDDGQSLVEFAVTLPVLLLVVTGLCTFGIAVNNYMQLTDATNVGARLLAISRGQTTDPCSTVSTAVYAAAPMLTRGNITFKTTLNGTSYPGASCSSSSTSTGAAGNLTQGSTATVLVTYPCSLKVYGATLVSSCTLTAQTAEMVQ